MNEAIQQLPTEDFLYYADTLHVPYGNKSKESVKEYVKSSIAAIMKEEVKALVIACNTATSIVVSELRNMYDIPIVGMEPAVRPAVEMNRSTGKRVLVLATALTLKQTKYTDLVSRVDDKGIVDGLPLPELVGFCESLNFDRGFMMDYFGEKLSKFNLNNYGTIVLGCTHYPFYKEILRTMLPDHIQIIDGSAGTVKRLSHLLVDADQLKFNGKTPNIKYMCSSEDPRYIRKMETALAILQSRES